MTAERHFNFHTMLRIGLVFATSVAGSMTAVAQQAAAPEEAPENAKANNPVATRSNRVIEQSSRRVVKIFGAGRMKNLFAYSSGFLVTPQGHIVTTWSHVLDEQEVTVVLHDGRRFSGKIVGAEPQLDLAVLKIDAEDLPYFDLEEAVTPAVGARVLSFSNMFKVAAGDEPVSVMHGVVAARTRLVARRGVFDSAYSGPVLVIDAITNNPGSGGGVITTRDGALAGMIGKELRNAQSNTWMNYAIPIAELKVPIQDIISGRFTPKTNPLESATAQARFLPIDFGLVMVPDVIFRTPAFVDAVIPNTSAADAKLRANDLVLFVNDQLIQSVRMLNEGLGRLEPGEILKMVVRRDNVLVPVELPIPNEARKLRKRANDPDDEKSE
ncbi:MAG: S1C family serine protease [Planctomycetota bacterium]|nr:S1C family serine protease [Planctomycetota bacterium]